MDVALIECAKRVLGEQDVPPKLASLASSLHLQSSAIPLKPNQEPARAHICCVLAIEQLQKKLHLATPDTSKPPIPPSQYVKLLSQFRDFLGLTPPKRSRRAARKAVTDLKMDLDDVGDTFDSDFHDSGIDDDDDDDDDDGDEEDSLVSEDEFEFDSPRKRAPVSVLSTPRKSPRKSNKSPQKTPQRSPRKKAAVTEQKIKAVGSRMGLNPETIDAVVFAYAKYTDLVKDGWGLLYGLFVVVSDRAEPVLGDTHEKRLRKVFNDLGQMMDIDRDEWINWTEQIVSGQSWIMNISVHEPQPVLMGAPGGWFQPV